MASQLGLNQGQQYMGRMQERLFWPRFTLINGICSLDSTFLLSLGAVSTLLLTDPSTAPSFCAHPVDWAPLRFSGETRRNQSADLISADETGRNQSAETHLLETVRQKAAPDLHHII